MFKKIITSLFGITRGHSFNRLSFFQMIAQYLAGIISFGLILIGAYYFFFSVFNYFQPFLDSSSANSSNSYPEFYSLIKGLLSSFELFFMAPIPILIIFSHRANIDIIFYDFLPKQNKPFLSDVKAKKGFISSIIGILSTFILGVFFDFFSKDSSNRNALFEKHFWYWFIIIISLLIFLAILIFYYNLLSNHKEDKTPDL